MTDGITEAMMYTREQERKEVKNKGTQKFGEFNDILIVKKERLSKESNLVLNDLEDILGNRNYHIVGADNFEKTDYEGKELVIAFGGDGTLLRASHYVKNIPVLGISAESKSEGFLMSLTAANLKLMPEILEGQYKIIERQRAQIKRNGIDLEELALNEIFVGATKRWDTGRYIIDFKGEKEEQKSSGVIVTTGTGSTAWYNSEGRDPFGEVKRNLRFDYNEPVLKFLVTGPYTGKVFCPKILHGEIPKGESIKFESTRYSGGAIAIDSTHVYDFNEGDCVEVSISDCPLKVIQKINSHL